MVGIALEGGGARGAFHMGAVKALLEHGYEIGGITGTSIGALNGALIAQGDFEAAYQMWESLSTPMIFHIDPMYYERLVHNKIDKDTVFHLASKVKDMIENRGIDTSLIRNLLEENVDEEKLRNSSVDFGLITVMLNDMKPLELFKEDIPQGQMIDYLMASASYPGFAPNKIDGKQYFDGGIHDNLPVNLLASKGYKEIIAVRTYGVGRTKKLRYRDINLTVILPSENLGQIFNFDHELICRNMKMGYYDALRVIQGVKGKHYYIQPLEEAYYFTRLTSLPDGVIAEMGEILGITQSSGKRMLFERIIPKVAGMLDLDAAAGYESIVIHLLETAAER